MNSVRNLSFPAPFHRRFTSSNPAARKRLISLGQRFGALAAGGLALAAALATLQSNSNSALQCEQSAMDAWKSSKPSIPDISHLDPKVIEDTQKPMRQRMETYVKLLQHRIVTALAAEEQAETFLVDAWLRKQGGEGISCVLQNGKTFDKAGVNISVVHGILPPAAIAQMSADHGNLVQKTGYMLDGPDAEVSGLPFYAAGLSLVVHPHNPFAPTVHFNYRYFELTHPPTLKDGSPNPRYEEAKKTTGGATEPVAWWFGGGTDLTPTYLFDDDAKHFHHTLKAAADRHDTAFYPAWKKWCDKYFWIKHRNEARGIGGIFFDDLTLPTYAAQRDSYIPLSDGDKATRPLSSSNAHDQESLFATIRSLGDAFIPAYLPVLQRRKTTPFDEAHAAWQAIRRGRYVEFNLVYDRGTKFGLQTPGARLESILMSLPLKARWEYMERWSGAETDMPRGAKDEGKHEKVTMEILRHPKDWV
ncbi:Coproporphyrinogen III oxidase [Tilletiaria anomala UBC 951]|uniref:coproporphyrinogen oxidase n=1 Tax=Tilletiaria anomala (strain ATCC 24038 / CBS 436.72 / UBC 951) TaxID=1037660 RepID=A0A066VWJ1_TILAU|nr:Coproporphyrinogen III oxidase [Tilletiaria anomala UBC 951]KDN46102.1 Coproporphyrinogen III oxidase [Tilletiaria anomala UBC 951]